VRFAAARLVVYDRTMARTTIDVDTDALEAARATLGTRSASDTVNAALREAVRRAELADFDVIRDIDIDVTVEELARWRDTGG
jgi:hypothetical protein